MDLAGPILFLSMTNHLPDVLTSKKQIPTPLQQPGRPGQRSSVQVLNGKDILGQAAISSGSKALRTDTNHPPRTFQGVFLRFDSAEQARSAAGLLRLPDVNPTPLPNQKANR